MIGTVDIELQYGGTSLFNHATVNFTAGNCYGIIGANGAGKSTFLKILSGEIEPTRGSVVKTPSERISILNQNHFEFDEFEVLKTVVMGNQELCRIMEEKEYYYNKEEMTEEEGLKLCDLEEAFNKMDGWNAESDAAILLNGLGITNEFHDMYMKELTGDQKVKILLAQAIFGQPDILLMDEPTNHLDVETIVWLEDFLVKLENSTIIIVSHDRHFLNEICTHIVDVDFGKITMVAGNYDFWFDYTQLRQRQIRDQNKKAEVKIKELQDFIARFSANASKSKQATSRKKQLNNIDFEDAPVSLRKFPYIAFKPNREVGNDVLTISGISKTIGDRKVLDNISFTINPHEKVAFVGADVVAKTTLFKILAGELEPDEGKVKWGVTTTQSFLPTDNSRYFDGSEDTIVDWVRRYSDLTYEADVRGWLGKLLFSGDEAIKKVCVLSGGERVRCMLCKMMLSGANVLILDEPTNHLDLESIAALNEGLGKYTETLLFTSHDHQLVQSVTTRVIDVTAGSYYDKQITFDEYLHEMKEKNIVVK